VNTTNTHNNGIPAYALPANQTMAQMLGEPTGETPSRVETITPARAKQLLATNPNNRKINERHTLKLATTIRENRWVNNGETIKIGIKDGKEILLDGQHRLTAVVKAEKTIRTHVIYGLDPEVFDTIDQGKKRSLSDVLGIAGYINTSALARTVKLVDMYKTRTMTWGSSDERYPNETWKDLLVSKYPELPDAVDTACSYNSSINPVSSNANTATALYIFREIDPIMADAFMDNVVHGYNLAHDNPILQLRNALIKQAHGPKDHKWKWPTVLAGLIRVWNAVRKGQTLHRSPNRFNGSMENFPRAK
tara:strand:+ start:1690 stop:2607 length:918 start_codon:yes stop_codon:yes gene_type:complete